MYQIFVSGGGRLEPGPRFRWLKDAVRFVESCGGTKSYAIRDPDGGWCRDSAGRSIFGRRKSGADGEWQAALAGGTVSELG